MNLSIEQIEKASEEENMNMIIYEDNPKDTVYGNNTDQNPSIFSIINQIKKGKK